MESLGEFDYVVVGAGSAGCVVAARLSESGRHSVALLEAGGEDDSFWVKVPLGFGKMYDYPKYCWIYESEPEAGLNGCQGPRAARPHAGRHQLDQRIGVFEGPARGFRSLARARQCRLGL